MKKGRNAIFLSNTKRDSPSSNIPGPGEYDVKYDHHVYKCKFDSFGSTTDRDIAFNRSIQHPFTDPTYLINPPVGCYYKQINKNNKENAKLFSPLQNQANSRQTNGFQNKMSPGPGSYDIGFKDELKTLDYQLSLRYQVNPFGSNTPRFIKKDDSEKKAENMPSIETTSPPDDSEKHK